MSSFGDPRYERILVENQAPNAIVRYARSERVGMIVIGRTQRNWWYRWQHGSVIDRILKGADNFDVLVVSFDEAD